jgi:hypothetical protein
LSKISKSPLERQIGWKLSEWIEILEPTCYAGSNYTIKIRNIGNKRFMVAFSVWVDNSYTEKGCEWSGLEEGYLSPKNVATCTLSLLATKGKHEITFRDEISGMSISKFFKCI